MQKVRLEVESSEAAQAVGTRLELVVVTSLAVALPLLLRHPQWFLGSAVNVALIYGALRASHWSRVMPLVFLPALAALAGGELFGEGVARAMLAVVPGIWLGNGALVYWMRSTRGLGFARYARAVAQGALLKAVVIGLWAGAVAAFGLLPWAFVLPFVGLQVMTAVAGGALSAPAARRRT